MCTEMLEFAGDVADAALERISPTAGKKILSKRIKSEEMSFNLLLTGYVYTPLLIVVGWTVHRQHYFVAFCAILVMIFFIAWCTSMVTNEMKIQRERKNDV